MRLHAFFFLRFALHAFMRAHPSFGDLAMFGSLWFCLSLTVSALLLVLHREGNQAESMNSMNG